MGHTFDARTTPSCPELDNVYLSRFEFLDRLELVIAVADPVFDVEFRGFGTNREFLSGS